MLFIKTKNILNKKSFIRPSIHYFTTNQSKNPEGDEDHENTSKDIGNPITWGNPTGGPSQDEKSPKYWKYVYPTGVLLILLSFYWGGRKRSKQEQKKPLFTPPLPPTTDLMSMKYL